MVFSLMFIIVSLTIQVMVWTVRIMFLFLRLMIAAVLSSGSARSEVRRV